MSNSSMLRSCSALVLGSCLGLMGCAGNSTQTPETGAPKVTISYPLKRSVTDYEIYTGRTAAVDSVQVRARVTGYLMKIHFKEGSEVKEGDLLFEIDPRSYQAQYDQAMSQVALNNASLKLAQVTYERDRSVATAVVGGISQQQLDQDLATVNEAAARVNAAKASTEIQKLNLDWTKVTAPSSGQIGYRLVTLGNLITADQTILTTIVSQDPMWVYFAVDEPTVVRIRQLVREGKIPSRPDGKVARVPIFVSLSGDKGFPHEGSVDFTNNQLDQATGTLLVRAVLPNPKPDVGDRLFSPAMFVRVRLPLGVSYSALLVSEAAVGTDQDLKYLFVVDEENKVVRRAVELGTQQDGLQVVTSGLKPGERVIVNGLQHVHPGVVVSPTLVEMPNPRGAVPQTPPTTPETPKR